jgi:hypothetical protein
MGIINRTFTYKTRIKVSTADLNLARAGKKKCTIRVGTLSVGREILDLTDGTQTLKIKVVRVETDRKYSALTDQDAINDGLASKAELDTDLKRFYGRIDPEQPMTIIHFELV